MRRSLYLLFSLLMVISMVLTACGGAAPTSAPAVEEPAVEEPVVEEPAEPVDEPATEPVVEEPVEAAPPDLDAAFSGLLAGMVGYNTVKADTLLEEMVDTPPFLVDVRTTAEVEENGHIDGAINIPLDVLAQNLNLLPDFDTPIVAYCGSGWRATIAMTALNALGWKNVRALKVTFAEWKDAGNPVTDGLPTADVLNAASPDAGLVAAVDAMLAVYGVKPYGVVSADDMNLAIGDNPDLVVLDVRTTAEVDEKGYVDAPNWVNIPLEELVAKKELWPAMDAKIAVYCGSGHRSTMALAILGTYGYANLSSLKGGFGEWAGGGFPVIGGMPVIPAYQTNLEAMLGNMAAYNTVKAEDLLVEMAEDQPPFLLDVRTTEEVETNGHIEGATHIPLAELAQHVDLLPAFDTPIVAYCGSGWRATIAMTVLHGMGWTNVRALKAAFADWVAAGNPVAAGLPENMALNVAEVSTDSLAAFDAMLAVYGVAPYGGISADDFNLALADDPALIVVDVRTVAELAEKGVVDVGEIEFVHIALEEFLANMDLWPADKAARIVVYCGSGHRSTMAATILGTYGYTNVWSLKSGFGGWVEAGYPVAEFVVP